MSNWQRRVLIGGLLLVFLAGMFPPVLLVWTRNGDNHYLANGRTFLPHSLALAPERFLGGSYRGRALPGYNRIDYWRLVVEWITIGSLAAAVILLLKPRQAGPEASPSETTTAVVQGREQKKSGR